MMRGVIWLKDEELAWVPIKGPGRRTGLPPSRILNSSLGRKGWGKNTREGQPLFSVRFLEFFLFFFTENKKCTRYAIQDAVLFFFGFPAVDTAPGVENSRWSAHGALSRESLHSSHGHAQHKVRWQCKHSQNMAGQLPESRRGNAIRECKKVQIAE